MRILLTILFVFILKGAAAQIPEQFLGSPNNRVVTRGQHKVDSTFILPTGKDTTGTANYLGALLFKSLYPYFYNGLRWNRVVSDQEAFIQNGNSFGDSARLGTNDNFDLVIRTSGQKRFTIDKNAIEMRQYSTGLRISSPLVAGGLSFASTPPAAKTIESSDQLNFTLATSPTNQLAYAFSANVGSPTSGDYRFAQLNIGAGTPFAPSSGDATLTMLRLAPAINQTGSASGITRGLYINPTITSSVDFRAIESDTGKVIFNGGSVGIGTGSVAPASKVDITTNGIATSQTQTSGLLLANNTAAAAGVQQGSPALRFLSNGWKTNATAGSQPVEYRVWSVPVQGTAAPTSYLLFERSINGGAYQSLLEIHNTGIRVGDGNGGGISLSGTPGFAPGVRQFFTTTGLDVITGSTPSANTFNFSATAGYVQTSGDLTMMALGNGGLISGFAPTSGTATYDHLRLAPAVNQTGGASGISRGLHVVPILTAAADFRAIETDTGNVIFRAGRVGINTTTPAASLDVRSGSAYFRDIGVTGRIPTAWSITSLTSITKTDTLASNAFGSMIEDLSGIKWNTGARGHVGMYSTAYNYSFSPITPGVDAYVAGFSSLPVWDCAGCGTLPFMYSYYASPSVAGTTTISKAAALYVKDANTSARVSGTASGISDNYVIFAEAMVKAQRNWGFYFDGTMHSYTGGKLSINTKTDTARGVNINRSVGINKDSLPSISTFTSEKFIVVDTLTNQLKSINPNDISRQVINAGTSNFTITIGALTVLPSLAGAGNRTITLPAASSHAGKFIFLWNKNADANLWSFGSTYTDPNGTTATTISNGTYSAYQSTGSEWLRIQNN